MELLAPAGSLEQALSSINAGCDALYGGLEKWNARINAKNFSVDEYNELMEICRDREIEFYMTLNTLFKDDEIENVIELFSKEDFIKPDAVIAADIGLISVLSDRFPDVDIHVSTQFGACGINDIEFLKSYGVRRVILSRELTLNEIKELRANTDIEIEAFVYGSQCICFSGQCLWSGLTQESSGNRGRCTAPCRDFYCYGNHIGQFLYPQDVNAEDIVRDLLEIGIDSLKIEGRYRDSKQTSMIVSAFRDAIDELKDTSKRRINMNYVGYMDNNVPVQSMFHILNPRTKTYEVDNLALGMNDLGIIQPYVNGIPTVVYNQEHNYSAKYCYIKTIASTGLNAENDGGSLALYFENNRIVRLLFTDNLRNQYPFVFDTFESEVHSVHDLFEKIIEGVDYRIVEISSNMPEFSDVHVSNEMLKSVIGSINQICKNSFEAKPSCDKIQVPDKDNLIQVNRCSLLCALKEKGFNNFIFEITSKYELMNVINEESDKCTVIYKLPILDFTDSINDLFPHLKGKKIMISKLSHLLYLDEICASEIIADYSVNTWNSNALGVLKKNNCTEILAHPELSIAYTAKLAKKNGFKLRYVYVGRLPIGYTRACFGENKLCDGNCGNTSFELKNLTKKYDVNVWCINHFGYRILTTSFISEAFKEFENYQKIYNLSYLYNDELACILENGTEDDMVISSIYGRSVL